MPVRLQGHCNICELAEGGSDCGTGMHATSRSAQLYTKNPGTLYMCRYLYVHRGLCRWAARWRLESAALATLPQPGATLASGPWLCVPCPT